MHFHLDSFFTLVTALAGIGMPWLISFVAVSQHKWINLLIAWGSSALLGVVTAAMSGKFSSDISLNILVAVVAAEATYQLYWSPKQHTVAEVVPAPVVE